MLKKYHSTFITSPKRAVSSCLGGSLLLLALTLWGMHALPSHRAYAQEQKQGGVVVQVDDHALYVRPITFTNPISGLTALQRSGLTVITTSTSFGTAVCSIAGVGCPATNCFCNGTKFWAYRYWDGNAWQDYSVGASTSAISRTGAIEGWRWGEFGSPKIPATQATAVLTALNWLQARQSITNGSYSSNVGASIETALAIGANGTHAHNWRRQANRASLADFLVAGAGYANKSVAGAGKLAVATSATASCWPAGALTPAAYYSPTLGAFSQESGPNAWAIIGSLAISQNVPSQAVQTLKNAAKPSGGWEWSPDWGADTNATALAIQALIASGESITSSTIVSGLNFLKTAQNSDGGFAYDPKAQARGSDANSTSYVVQALVAAGQDITGSRWTISNANPINYLMKRQLPDGSLEWQAGQGTNQLATQQAIPALLGRAYPLARTQVAQCPGVFLPLVAR